VPTYVPRPGRGAFVGLIPLGARAAAYGVEGPAVGAVTIARLQRSRRDGVWRANRLFGRSTNRSRGETARAAFERCVKTMQRPPVERTWAPVPQDASLADIAWLWRSRQGAAPADIDVAEQTLGARFPDGYREYVGAFGEAIDTSFLRVYPPARVRADLAAWRHKIDSYWFWAPADDGFGAEEAYESILIANTVNDDELVFHPDRPGTLYLLPRDEGVIAALRGSFLQALAWMAESGELGDCVGARYAMPLAGSAKRVLRPAAEGDRDARTLVAGAVEALCAVDPSARVVGQEDGGRAVLLPTLGGLARVAANGNVMFEHDPSAPSADVERLERALAKLGIGL
jgi:hypothetical protein